MKPLRWLVVAAGATLIITCPTSVSAADPLSGLTVKRPWVGVGQIKCRGIDHPIALDALDAQRTQTAQQQPQTLDHQGGVTAALHVHIAAQHATLDGAIGIDRSAPGVAWAQGVECRTGGEQLHERRWVDRLLRQVADQGGATAGRCHHHVQGTGRQIGLGQGL